MRTTVDLPPALHRLTDAYLVALARSHGARLATLDQALVRTYPQHAFLIADR